VSLCELIIVFPALCLLVFAFSFSFQADRYSRRRQGNWGEVDVELGFRLLLQADG
jgi:hypothetical protein